MNHKSLITLLVVIIIILTGVSVYFATNSNVVRTQPSEETEVVLETIKIEENLEGAEEDVETITFKTYSNSDAGFSIDYPNDWPIREGDCSDPSFECEFTFGDLPQGPGDREGMINYVSVAIRSSEISDGVAGFMVETEDCENYDYVTLPSGLEAGMKTCQAIDGFVQYRFAFENNDSLYTIGGFMESGGKAIDEFDDMLQSFTFIE